MKNKKPIIFTALSLVIIGVIGMSFTMMNNEMKRKEEAISASFNDVYASLRVRYELIPSLLDDLSDYATYENDLFINCANANSYLSNACTVQEMANGDLMVETAIAALFTLSETYPELNDDAVFLELRKEFDAAQIVINEEKLKYNDLVANFNSSIREFPLRAVAIITDTQSIDFFKASQGKNTFN